MRVDKKSIVKAGANKQNRTADLFLTKEVLYQLSYVGPVHHPLRGKEPLTQYPRRLQGNPSRHRAGVRQTLPMFVFRLPKAQPREKENLARLLNWVPDVNPNSVKKNTRFFQIFGVDFRFMILYKETPNKGGPAQRRSPGRRRNHEHGHMHARLLALAKLPLARLLNVSCVHALMRTNGNRRPSQSPGFFFFRPSPPLT